MDAETIRAILDNAADPYKVLGVQPQAKTATIRRSYYKLSLHLHPDKNPQYPLAKEAFIAVTRAYEILSDDLRRSAFDKYGLRGLEVLEHNNGQLPSLTDVIMNLLRFLFTKIVERAASRALCPELVVKVFPSREPTDPHAFAHRNEAERRQCRRELWRYLRRVLFAAVLVTSVWWLGAMYMRQPVAKAMPPPSTDYDLLLAHSPYTQSLPTYQPEPIVTRLSLSCLAQSFRTAQSRDAGGLSTVLRWFLQCQPQADDVMATVLRYGGSEEAGQAAGVAYLTSRCADEASLHWASLERFKPTAKLTRQGRVPVPANLTQSAKRKYPRRYWWPKFTETFSVSQESELFVPTSVCTRLWQLLTPTNQERSST